MADAVAHRFFVVFDIQVIHRFGLIEMLANKDTRDGRNGAQSAPNAGPPSFVQHGLPLFLPLSSRSLSRTELLVKVELLLPKCILIGMHMNVLVEFDLSTLYALPIVGVERGDIRLGRRR